MIQEKIMPSTFWKKIILFNSKTEQSKQTDRLTEFLHTWCANSCDTTTATRCLLLSEDTPSLKSKAVSRYVIKPQFSMAPDEKSGMAIISELENMVGVSGVIYSKPEVVFSCCITQDA